MDADQLKSGLLELDALSRAEYQKPLDQVLKEGAPEDQALRVGRLVGVLLKQPFATAQDRPGPSGRTGAYRSWNLVAEPQFAAGDRKQTWQYQALAHMCRDVQGPGATIDERRVYAAARAAQTETGFFGLFAQDVRKYICGDPAIRQKIEDTIKTADRPPATGQAAGPGRQIPVVTPESVVGAAGLALGAALVQAVPVLGIVGAPVIAGVVLIIYTLGVDAFCRWSGTVTTAGDEAH
jgi:hypothetical protein